MSEYKMSEVGLIEFNMLLNEYKRLVTGISDYRGHQMDHKKKMVKWIESHTAKKVQEAEISLARKVLGVVISDIKGRTMKVKLALLGKKMNEIIPDNSSIESELVNN
jgi:hypothetical protein